MSELEDTWLERRLRSFHYKAKSDPTWDLYLEKFYKQNTNLDSYLNYWIQIHNGIGDQVCILGLLPEIKRLIGAKHTIAFAKKQSSELIKLFPKSIDCIIECQDNLPFTGYSSGSLFNTLHRPSKAHIFDGQFNSIFTNFCIPYVDQYRIGMHLPLNSLFTPPNFRLNIDAVDFEVVNTLNNGVILFPHSNTWPAPNFDFWKMLADNLKSNGLKVFTNVKNSVNNSGFIDASKNSLQTAIPGTIPIDCNLTTLLASGESLKASISGVSGPAWLLAHAKCKKIVLHLDKYIPKRFTRTTHNEKINLIEIDKVSNNFPNENIIDIRQVDTKATIETIIKEINFSK